MREQIFSQIDYDRIDTVRGLDGTITTTANTDEEARELLRALGMPFRERDVAKTSAESQGREDAPLQVRNYTPAIAVDGPRAVFRKFGVCRICLRELEHQGAIPGMTKSSW